jgi:hypothetical protein
LISAVRKLIVKSQPHLFAFQQGNTGSFFEKEAENSDYLNQLNVSKPSVASISQKRKNPKAPHCVLDIGKCQPPLLTR